MATQQLVIFNTVLNSQDILPESDWTALTLWAMLLRNDGAGNGQEWFARSVGDMKDVASITSLLTTYQAKEITSTGYARTAVTPNQISVDTGLDFSRFRIAETSIEFGNPVGDAGSQQTIEAVLIYQGVQSNANDATNIPLMMQEYGTGKQTADGPVTANFTNQTLWNMAQA
jgi:hypothetical protein